MRLLIYYCNVNKEILQTRFKRKFHRKTYHKSLKPFKVKPDQKALIKCRKAKSRNDSIGFKSNSIVFSFIYLTLYSMILDKIKIYTNFTFSDVMKSFFFRDYDGFVGFGCCIIWFTK